MCARNNELDAIQNKITIIYNIRNRWACESQHEEWSSYANAMKLLVPEGFTFIKATKRPFGFQLKTPSGLKLHIHIKRKGRHEFIACKPIR